MLSKLSDLLIIDLKFTAKSVEGAKKEKKSNQYVVFQNLKIINYTTNVANVKKDVWHLLVD